MKVNLFLLFLVFMVLKLCGVIDWSWLIVTMPLWFGFAVLALVAVSALSICTLFALGGRLKVRAKKLSR